MRHCYNCESFELINVLYFLLDYTHISIIIWFTLYRINSKSSVKFQNCYQWQYENQRSNLSTAILFVYCHIRRSCSFHCTDRGKSYLLLSKSCVKTPSIFWQIVCFGVACNLNAVLKPNMKIFVLNEVDLSVLKIFQYIFNEMIKQEYMSGKFGNHTCNQNYQWF